MLQTYKIWEGERTFLPGDDTGKYTVIEIVAEELGWFEDVNPDGFSGTAYYVYRAESGEIIINVVNKNYGIGEPSRAVIYSFSSLEEAAQSEQRYTLEELRLI
jgi:hypothetical protein